MRALSFDGGRDHTSGDRKYMLYIPLGADEELSVSCGRGDVGGSDVGGGDMGGSDGGGGDMGVR